ncbi:MMPL family transporter [Parageobacillus thermoglucosidasius]|uniref:MMPL family transporter n=1 Tax=Parageobacillus thermoglucosidasius TaxID=1426 RepID=A0AB38QW51_PARTM|nr:MMPL family transporter [Parageobacillus thermoglucosidasius]UOE75618.1 MMPL family transporter [Parageobacillus thermoglucosidasius]
MRKIIKGKWFILLAWLVAAVVLMVAAPNMADLVREKGQLSVPKGYSSSLAIDILNEMQKKENKENELSTALVFYRKGGLTDNDWKEAQRAIRQLEAQKDKLGITEIISPFAEKELKDQLVSKDGTTILTSVKLERNGRSAKAISKALYKAIDDISVEHYYTGGWLVDEDVVVSSQEGLKKTEGITVVFILVVLLIVFRSFVAPLIPLVTVGMTYLVSQSLVAFLVDQVNFPLSTFTQIFLVAVLFGIGTDYCILLLSRFKEELSQHESIADAIIATYRTAGKTVLFSGIAVMIGFAAIGLSTFKLYQSAAAVAVGVAVLLVALMTLVPFFMATLGPKLFWPAKGNLEHKQSRLWDAAGRFAFARPLIALGIVAVITVPVLATYDGDLSFDSLEEIGDDYASVKAFNIIAKSFNPGEAMPTQIVMKNDEALNSQEYFALIEKISREVEKVDGVDKVRSVTRPTGEPIEQLLVTEQAKSLKNGLGQGKEGIEKISSGLNQASGQLSASAPKLKQATNGIGQLVSGTEQLKAGVGDLQKGLAQIEQGIRSGSLGAGEIKKGLATIRDNAKKLQQGAEQLLQGYEKAGSGLASLADQYERLQSGMNALSQQLSAVSTSLNHIEQTHPELRQDTEYQQTKMVAAGLAKQSQQMAAGFAQLNTALKQVSAGVRQANDSFAQLIGGQKALIDGMAKLIAGLDELQKGMDKAANGQRQVIERLPQLANGLSEVNTGQKQLLQGFSQLDGQVNQLITGLDQSAAGLREVSKGLGTAQSYLSELSASPNEEMTGWYLPKQVLESKEFAKAQDAFMSQDKKIVTFDVIFDENPYSTSALNKIDDIKQAVARAVKDTKLENAKVAVGGVTSIYSDLHAISSADYSRTVVLMLAGITLILMILLRSLIMPMYLILSLILTYYTSMAVTELVFVNVLGYAGLNWAVSFFAFVILIALGIDYSIFLMDRFNEYRDMPVQEAMLISMRNMGTVIISAAVILGGTFAAMYPSGVLSLLQIATIILTGLILYALVVLPLFVPVMVKTFGKANWWPFIK